MRDRDAKFQNMKKVSHLSQIKSDCIRDMDILIDSEGGTGENQSYVTHLNFRTGPIFLPIGRFSIAHHLF